MKSARLLLLLALIVLLASPRTAAQDKRKIIIDQDELGPAGTDLHSTLLLIESPQTDVLGITVVTGDGWLREEVAHTLRMLELIGRTDIPVMAGAEYPLVRTKEETEQWEQQFGRIDWLGAWTPRVYHPAEQVGELREGNPRTKAASEDAAHFLVRTVRQFPNQITLYAGGPMTNLALAISLDPEFPNLVKELVFMGGSLAPQTDDPEFANFPQREFNLWFDPEAAHIVLRARWKKIVCTPVDISVKTAMTRDLLNRIKQADTPAARYIGQYTEIREFNYLWDELAALAWLDPSIITKKQTRFLDVDLDRGAGYGTLLTWTPEYKPRREVQSAEIQFDLDSPKFYKLMVDLLSVPTPKATH
jgi:purine nucleosidase